MEKIVEKWFYRVIEKVSVYDENNKPIQNYEHTTDFVTGKLPIIRIRAIHYFNKRGFELPEREQYIFISPAEITSGQPYAFYSATLYFVCWYSDRDFEENVIAGEDEEENAQGLDVESIVWKEYGFDKPVKIVSIPVD